MKRNKHPLLSVFTALVLAVGFNTITFAGFDEGLAAYNAKNYGYS